jgi:hypothetical protein
MNTKTRVRQRNTRLNCEVLESRQLLSGYLIVNAASGLVLTDPNYSPKSGTVIQQSYPDGGENQQWNLVKQSNGLDVVQNAFSGKVLDDPKFQNGTKIQQADEKKFHFGSNQQWKFVKLPDGNYEVKNAWSGKVLADPGSSTQNGTNIQQDTFNGGRNQQWVLLAAGTTYDQGVFVQNVYSGKVLIDPNLSTQNGSEIRQDTLQYGLDPNPEQWDLVALTHGNDLIVNVSSGKVLTVPGLSLNGTAVYQDQLNGGLNQQWQLVLVPQANGTSDYEVKNAYSGLVLTDPGPSTSDGTLIDEESYGGTLNQQWILQASFENLPPGG